MFSAAGILKLLMILVVFKLVNAQDDNSDCSVCGMEGEEGDDGGEEPESAEKEKDVGKKQSKGKDVEKRSKYNDEKGGNGYRDPKPSDDKEDEDDDGMDAGGLIVDGELVAPGKYPWIVGVSNGASSCGGAIINKSWILTAAHCVLKEIVDPDQGTNDPSEVTVDVWLEQTEEPAKNIPVDKIIAHPKMESGAAFKHDIALIKLKENLKCSKKISPICIPKKKSIEEDVETFQIAGRGLTEDGNHGSLDGKLREGTIKRIEGKKCIMKDEEFETGAYSGPVSSIVCALPSEEKEQIVCQGDSGSSIFSKIDGVYYSIGVASTIKKGQCVMEAKQAFARTAYYYKWIKKNAKKLPEPQSGGS